MFREFLMLRYLLVPLPESRSWLIYSHCDCFVCSACSELSAVNVRALRRQRNAAEYKSLQYHIEIILTGTGGQRDKKCYFWQVWCRSTFGSDWTSSLFAILRTNSGMCPYLAQFPWELKPKWSSAYIVPMTSWKAIELESGLLSTRCCKTRCLATKTLWKS